MKLFATWNFHYFYCQANQWKFHAVKMDFIIEIYRKKAQSVKISCTKMTGNLKSVWISCSKNFMNYSIHFVVIVWLYLLDIQVTEKLVWCQYVYWSYSLLVFYNNSYLDMFCWFFQWTAHQSQPQQIHQLAPWNSYHNSEQMHPHALPLMSENN